MSIIKSSNSSLVVTNPQVQKLSSKFRWRPETTILRIQRALPAVVEQQIYLALVPQFGESGFRPESIATLFRMFLGHYELQIGDLSPNSPGKTRYDDLRQFLADCVYILKVVVREFPAFSIKVEDAGMIALHYGKEDPERLIEMVDNNLEEICDLLDVSNYLGYDLRMRLCVHLVVTKMIPYNRRTGAPDLLDITDFLGMPSAKRRNLRIVFSQEVPDYLSGSVDDWRHYDSLRILKELGVA